MATSEVGDGSTTGDFIATSDALEGEQPKEMDVSEKGDSESTRSATFALFSFDEREESSDMQSTSLYAKRGVSMVVNLRPASFLLS